MMQLLADRQNRRLLIALSAALALFFALTQALCLLLCRQACAPMALLFLLLSACVLSACLLYLKRQQRILERAVAQIEKYLRGDSQARIDCDEEGELYRLFHAVNTLAAVLNAHAANELRDKAFLKDTISDVSHQLKTPLAALSIYNGLIQGEEDAPPSVREFAALSERELDRMETLVANLLKIARLDAGAIVLEKAGEELPDMMQDLARRFAFRAAQEHKTLSLSGGSVQLLCDRHWMLEALGNIVKNAFDHTGAGDSIRIEWKRFASVVQIRISDTGCGIHPEDLPHIFKRFYRSRFSKDIQGVGLGLPLAKAIIEAHGGSIEVRSEPGRGTALTLSFLIPTEL